MTSSIDHLPEDVLINRILLKLDTKSLGRLRCVCKHLRSSITNPDFVNMHCHDQFNNNNTLVLLVPYTKNRSCSLNFNDSNEIDPSRPKRTEIVNPFSLASGFFGSCNGLLCLVEREGCPPPSLWNPTTKEYKRLPPIPSLPSSGDVFWKNIVGGAGTTLYQLYHKVGYGFGYDRIINDYKVIQCRSFSTPTYDTNYSLTEFLVYTLGTNTWSRINDNPYKSYVMSSDCYHDYLPGMFVDGALHWIMRDKEGSKIIALDIEKEMFLPEVPKPHSQLTDSDHFSLHVLRGCLCIYEKRYRQGCHVWMMKDYGVMDSWTKLFTFTSISGDLKVLKFWENGQFLVAKTNPPKNYEHKYYQKLVLYDPKNKKSEGRVILGEIGCIYCIEVYIESLVSLNTGIYKHDMV